MSEKTDRYWDGDKQQWIYPNSGNPDPNSIPMGAIPNGWRFLSCIRSSTGEFWVQLEGPEKPWPIRTAGAWGPTLRAAVENASFEACP